MNRRLIGPLIRTPFANNERVLAVAGISQSYAGDIIALSASVAMSWERGEA
jgi:hypothetical protein